MQALDPTDYSQNAPNTHLKWETFVTPSIPVVATDLAPGEHALYQMVLHRPFEPASANRKSEISLTFQRPRCGKSHQIGSEKRATG